MKKLAIILVIIIAVGASAFFALQKGGETLRTYDNLTACLRENNVVMFGAYWCPECAKQKALFERGAKNIPYYECSPNGSSQPQDNECTIRTIGAYPTWQFNEEYLATLPDETWETLITQYETVQEQIEANLPEGEESPLADLTGETNFEKLTSIDPTTGITSYNQGRISGRRSLEEIAIYSNCEAALEQDIQASNS